MDNLYVVTVEISSDSGVGPYSEEKTICNCTLEIIKGAPVFTAGVNTKPLYELFHTNSVEYDLKVKNFKRQKDYYYSY